MERLGAALALSGAEAAAVDAELDAGALIDEPSRNDMGVRPINAAAAGQHPVGHIRILLASGANVDGRQSSGHTAFDEAKIRGDQALIDLLTTRGDG